MAFADHTGVADGRSPSSGSDVPAPQKWETHRQTIGDTRQSPVLLGALPEETKVTAPSQGPEAGLSPRHSE